MSDPSVSDPSMKRVPVTGTEPAPWSWRVWGVSFALLSALLGAWVVATPLFGQPDEPAHYLKASSLVRGQLLGDVDPQDPEGPTVVLVPRGMRDIANVPGCYAFRTEMTPDCYDGDTGPRGEVLTAIETQAGRYPPLYYAATGWPTLLRPSLDVLYAVRALSALLCAALLATAVTAAAVTRRRLLVVAVGVAISPMVVFLGSGVNPGSVEIAAAIAFWVGGLALVTTRGRPQALLVSAVGLAGCALVLARPISPFWGALIGLALLALGGRRVLELIRCRSVQVWAGLLVLCALAQVAWVLRAGALDLGGTGLQLPWSERLDGSLELLGRRSHELVGYFGWLDTPAPPVTLWVWCGAAVLVLLAGLWRATPWRFAVLLLTAAGVVVVPLALELPAVNEVGFYWQGRYTLPLAVGVPLVAAVLTREVPGRSRVRGLLLALVGVGLVVGHLTAFATALSRNTVGLDQGFGFFVTRWEPPVPVHLLLPAFGLATLLYAAWLLRLPLPKAPSGTLEPCVSSSPAVPASSGLTTSVSS